MARFISTLVQIARLFCSFAEIRTICCYSSGWTYTTLRDVVILCFWNTSTREISLRCKSSTECRWYKISRNVHFESVRESPAISRKKHHMVLVCVTRGDPWFAMEQSIFRICCPANDEKIASFVTRNTSAYPLLYSARIPTWEGC